jgi:hypothetical protein
MHERPVAGVIELIVRPTLPDEVLPPLTWIEEVPGAPASVETETGLDVRKKSVDNSTVAAMLVVRDTAFITPLTVSANGPVPVPAVIVKLACLVPPAGREITVELKAPVGPVPVHPTEHARLTLPVAPWILVIVITLLACLKGAPTAP